MKLLNVSFNLETSSELFSDCYISYGITCNSLKIYMTYVTFADPIFQNALVIDLKKN